MDSLNRSTVCYVCGYDRGFEPWRGESGSSYAICDLNAFRAEEYCMNTADSMAALVRGLGMVSVTVAGCPQCRLVGENGKRPVWSSV